MAVFLTQISEDGSLTTLYHGLLQRDCLLGGGSFMMKGRAHEKTETAKLFDGIVAVAEDQHLFLNLSAMPWKRHYLPAVCPKKVDLCQSPVGALC